MNIINNKSINLCGSGFQTEALIRYCKKYGINVNCIVVACYTQKPEQCYISPSRRKADRNSFSEVDMCIDPLIEGIPVRRADSLLEQDRKSTFVLTGSEESQDIYDLLKHFTDIKWIELSEDQIRTINNDIFDIADLVCSLWESNKFMYSEIQRLKNSIRRQMAPTVYDFHFEFHIVEHCNLNCRGCTHFSPLARQEYLSLTEFERDIVRLAFLTSNKARFINLLGGEPLLHPNVEQFAVIARKYFPESVIRIVSNGILVPRMNDKFWSVCRENHIILGITQYPVSFDYDKAIQIIEKNQVKFESFSGDNMARVEMWKLVLDAKKMSRPIDNFMRCPRANACVFISHGKLYNCATMANIHHFNSFFGQHYELEKADYIDIYEVNDVQELFDFLCKPKPFCRYCNIDRREYGGRWEKSKFDINEWT